MALAESYRNFIERWLQLQQQQGIHLQTWADTASPSPCQLQELDEDLVSWQPVEQQPEADFSNVEHALELKLHPDIKTFYGRYFGAGLTAEHSRGLLSLLMVWNQDDLARLQENMIGHILMKRRLKQRETLFFGLTDDDSLVLSVLNATGEVYLEPVGKEVTEKLADNLAEFIESLVPAAASGQA